MAHPWTASVMREMNLQSPGIVQPLDIGSGEHGTPERAPYRELPRVQPAVATARPAGWALESDGIHLPLLRVQFERPVRSMMKERADAHDRHDVARQPRCGRRSGAS